MPHQLEFILGSFIHSQIHTFLYAIIHACVQASMLAFIYSHIYLCKHACKLICLVGFEKGAHVAQAGLEIPVLPIPPWLWLSPLEL